MTLVSVLISLREMILTRSVRSTLDIATAEIENHRCRTDVANPVKESLSWLNRNTADGRRFRDSGS